MKNKIAILENLNMLEHFADTGETKIHLVQNKEFSQLRFMSCENPFCDCGQMDLFIFKEENVNNLDQWHKFDLNVYEEFIEVTDKYKMSKEVESKSYEIQKELANELTKKDWEHLKECYLYDKVDEVESGDYDDEYIDFLDFGYNQMANPDMIISFFKVFPRG